MTAKLKNVTLDRSFGDKERREKDEEMFRDVGVHLVCSDRCDLSSRGGTL